MLRLIYFHFDGKARETNFYSGCTLNRVLGKNMRNGNENPIKNLHGVHDRAEGTHIIRIRNLF